MTHQNTYTLSMLGGREVLEQQSPKGQRRLLLHYMDSSSCAGDTGATLLLRWNTKADGNQPSRFAAHIGNKQS